MGETKIRRGGRVCWRGWDATAPTAERKRGVYTEAMRKANIAAGEAKYEQAKRTVCGVTGTVDELVTTSNARCPPCRSAASARA